MLFGYIFGGVFCGIGLIFFLIGFIMNRIRTSKERRYTTSVIGTVVGTEVGYNRDSGRSYYPVFEYNVGGQSYRRVSLAGYGGNKQQEVGQRVTIYYDPDYPYNYYVKEYTMGKTLSYIFLSIGSIFFIIGAVTFVFCLKIQ